MNVNNKMTNTGNLIKRIDQEKGIIIIAAIVALRHAHAHDHDRGGGRDGEKVLMERLDIREEERGATHQQQRNYNKNNQTSTNDDDHYILLGTKGKEATLDNNS